MKRVALIGARSLDDPGFETYADAFSEVALKFAEAGFILRSGNAKGADDIAQTAYMDAFRQGKITKEHFEVYLPWNGFRRGSDGYEHCIFHPITSRAKDMARDVHPRPERLTTNTISLHGRNVYQIFGHDFNTPVDIVVCYTANGMVEGGTATAINLALNAGIRVINIAQGDLIDRLNEIEFYLERYYAPVSDICKV